MFYARRLEFSTKIIRGLRRLSKSRRMRLYFDLPMKFQNRAEARRISRVVECSVDDCKRRRAGIQDFQTGDFVHKRALERRNFKHD